MHLPRTWLDVSASVRCPVCPVYYEEKKPIHNQYSWRDCPPRVQNRSNFLSTADRSKPHKYLNQKINHCPTHPHLQSSNMDRPQWQSGYVYAAQRELMKKHHEAKSRVHSVSGVGGGVSMWPAMDDMRLTRREANWLVVSCGVLIIGTMSVFLACHGGCIN